MELLKARATLFQNASPKALDSIFIRHKISKSDFDSWMKYYADHPTSFIELRNKVTEKLTKERVFVNTLETK